MTLCVLLWLLCLCMQIRFWKGLCFVCDVTWNCFSRATFPVPGASTILATSSSLMASLMLSVRPLLEVLSNTWAEFLSSFLVPCSMWFVSSLFLNGPQIQICLTSSLSFRLFGELQMLSGKRRSMVSLHKKPFFLLFSLKPPICFSLVWSLVWKRRRSSLLQLPPVGIFGLHLCLHFTDSSLYLLQAMDHPLCSPGRNGWLPHYWVYWVEKEEIFFSIKLIYLLLNTRDLSNPL